MPKCYQYIAEYLEHGIDTERPNLPCSVRRIEELRLQELQDQQHRDLRDQRYRQIILQKIQTDRQHDQTVLSEPILEGFPASSFRDLLVQAEPILCMFYSIACQYQRYHPWLRKPRHFVP